MKRLIVLLLVVASNAFGAQVWYSAVTVDHTKVPSNQTNFAVLVSQTDNRFKVTGSGGHVTSSSGFDIRPYSDAALTTALTYELEKYVSTTGELEMWVKIGTLSSTVDTVIYLGYGDAALTTDGSSTATWDANYVAVWHMKDGTTLALTDSTAGGYTLTNTAVVSATSGQVDGAANFNGTSQALNTGNLNLGATFKVTVSAWVDWTTYASDDDLMFEYRALFSAGNAFLIDPNAASTKFDVNDHAATGFNGGNFTRPASGLKYFVFTFDRTLGTALTTAAYVNAVSQTMTQTSSADMSGVAFDDTQPLNMMSRNHSSLFGAGKLDEVRVSNVIRSADWVTTNYNNQSVPSSFETLGTETSTTSTTSTGFFLFFP